MTTLTRQYIISVPNLKVIKKENKPYFFELAKKHIFKKKGLSKNLSREVDKIVYGI